MNRTVRTMIYTFLSGVNAIVPKKDRVMVYGGECLHDNNEAMFEYLNDYSDLSVVCIANLHRDIKCRKDVRFVKNTVWNAIKYSLTSRILIDSFFHAIRMKPYRGQKSIQLWHGTPLKRIDHHKGENNSKYYTQIIYPSRLFCEIYKRTFECTESKLFLCGNPRNDLLFEPKLGSLKKEGIDRYVIWMPTYRHGFGTEEAKKDIPVVTKENIKGLNSILKARKIYLFIKPHPQQTVPFESVITQMSNIGLLTDTDLRAVNIPLYCFIGAMNALLTDYSSVYFDYLLLNRPIGFVIEDYEEYKQNRGLYFDNPLSMMPGDKIYDIHQLKNFFCKLGNEDLYKDQRKEVNERVNHFQGNQNRQHIMELIQR